MPDLYSWVKPLFWRLNPETAHRLSILGLKLVPRQLWPDPSVLEVFRQTLWGRTFNSPIGLAAGYDKDADVVDRLYELGFGFVEIGGVTLYPQPGNERPRVFRLAEDRAIINRMGLNSAGADAVASRLSHLSSSSLAGPLLINLGLNKDSPDPPSDYAELARRLAPFADVLTINVSSPNTPGLRALQEPEKLQAIVDAVRSAVSQSPPQSAPAVLIKIAPDLSDSDVDDLAQFALSHGLEGMVVSNTTVARPRTLQSRYRHESGGLSGAPLFEPSTKLLAKLYGITKGRIPLIGVGGVSSGAEAYAKIRAGASLVQLYTALVYEGPGLVGRVTNDLSAFLRKDGFESITQAIGADHHIGSQQ